MVSLFKIRDFRVIVFREAPPPPPPKEPVKIIEVCSKIKFSSLTFTLNFNQLINLLKMGSELTAPPARKIVLEKLPDQPAKPPNVIIEKWLPYKPRTRRVVHERYEAPTTLQPHNLIIEWETPQVNVERVFVDLGVVDTVPEEYARKYAGELKPSCEIPTICSCHLLPAECKCSASDPSSFAHITTMNAQAGSAPTAFLEGDVHALSLLTLLASY
jgi:hypothetical protein